MTTAALVAATAVVVSGGAHQAGAAPGPTTQTITRTFHYSGVGAAYTVPAGTVSLAVSVTGAAGGYDGARFQDGKEGAVGGLGMQVNATLPITAGSAVQPGDQLYVSVGSVGTASSYHLSKFCDRDGDCDFDYSCYQPGAGGSSPLGLMPAASPNLSGGGGGEDGVALVGGNAGGCGAGGGAGSAIVLASGAPFVVAGGGGGGGGAGLVDADNDGAISADHLGGDGGYGDNSGSPGDENDNPYSAGPAGVTNGASGTAGSSGGSGSAVNGWSTGGGGGGGGGYTTGTGNGGGSGGGHGSGGGGGGAGGMFYLDPDPHLVRGSIEGARGDEVGNGIVTITATIGGGAALLTLGVFNPGLNQTFTVPRGVDQIDVDAVGALGGGSGATAFASAGGNQSASASPGAPGAEVKATINVQPGQRLTINVGTVGSYDRNGGDPHAGRGGNFSAAQYAGGGGGGAAWIVDSTSKQNLIAAGGGGGSGGVTTAFKKSNGNGGAAGTQPATPAAMPGANGTKGSGGSAGLGGGATGCTGKQSANGGSPNELDLTEGGGGGGGSGGFAHAGCGGGTSAGGGGGESAVVNGQLIATPSPTGYGDGLIVLSAHLPAGSTLIPDGSNVRSALTGTTFTSNLQVLLRDPDNVPLPSIPVTFTVASGAYFGTPTTTSDTELTDSNGIATAATLTAGLAAGQYTLTAAVPGGPSTGFTLTVVPMSITAMNPTQTIPDFGSFAPLAATVTAGQGLSVAGLSVTFAVAAGQSGITFPSGATSVVATTNFRDTVGSPAPIATGPIGTVQVTATIAITGQSTTFTLTTTPLKIQAVTGAPQSTLVDTDYPAPLVARVVDQDFDPQPGVTVYFVDPSGNIHFDDTATSSTQVVTDSNGLATSPALQPTTAGQITVLAGVTANPSALPQTPPAQFALSTAVAQ